MANYIPSGVKRPLTAEEQRAVQHVTGYNYIPSGGLKPEPVAETVVNPQIAHMANQAALREVRATGYNYIPKGGIKPPSPPTGLSKVAAENTIKKPVIAAIAKPGDKKE